ncbi:small ribosomal subunit biogenesis GTPase RsgA [Thiohalomonas denitrificans]|uniref:Small ribosomal subunit biogenesis GTPase RsgA n=1 Tax=Thiohalomonas denitrificans TaxID=415747 RepID=A0A1G5Q386_9GAMM|nr:small ribosomal subunit biogenesis GTPase RsgA [Thiohalomonas denitrificans]SCZ56324.1 ribosome biogenesis GTPase [Thiohalomonas denitrificans]
MGKQKLNRRQAWRIRKVQDERLERAKRREGKIDTEAGPLGQEQHGRIVANYGASVDVEDPTGEVRRCHLRQNLAMPVVGDRVVWQSSDNNSGVVVAVEERDTLLARPDFSGDMKALAANIDQILVVAAPEPPFSTESLDQFLVAAEISGITPVVVFNKVDLLDREGRAEVEAQLSIYRDIGYRVIFATTRADHGLDDLLTALKDKTSIFAGQSGVGKSSLAKSLLPDEAITVGDLAELTGLGRHTTSSARLYHLPSGGDVIDSPGVREFRLWPMSEPELAEGFPEFHPFLGGCRFRDCRHRSEPGCAILAAVEAGKIKPQRLTSFRRIAANVAEKAPSY